MDDRELLKERIKFTEIHSDKENVYSQLIHKIENQVKDVAKGVSLWWKYSSIAACTVLVLLSSSYMYKKMFFVPKQFTVTSMRGGKANIVLPDNSIVCLNGESSILYPEKFADGSREVKITGEAYFNVTHNKKSPFIVHTSGMAVKVLGTKFNVLVDNNNNQIETTLVEGSVELIDESYSQNKRPNILLKPNQQALFKTTNRSWTVKNVNAKLYASWSNGDYDFDGLSLKEITRILERSFGVRIQIQRKTLENVELCAKFKNGETIDQILSALQVSADYNYDRLNNVYIIR